MLKKRLLSSVMASIMAVSAFSVVTSADATATTTEAPVEEAKAVKTKAELKAYVDSFTGEFKADIYKFGTYAAERWNKALAVADAALNAADATDEETSNAYYYLKTATDGLKTYTKAELDALVKKHTKLYDTANILNEDVGDIKYNANSFTNFEIAYEAARDTDASDAESITNNYVDLENAYNSLSELQVVTKTEYAALIRKYDAAKNNVNKYESWRRGSTTVSGSTSNYNTSASAALTWGDIIANGFQLNWSVTTAPFDDDDADPGVTNAALYGSYDTLAGYAQVNRTTDTTIVTDYNEGVKTLEAITNFKPDSYTRSSKTAVERLIKDNMADISTLVPDALEAAMKDAGATNKADFEAKTKKLTGLKYRVTTSFGTYAVGKTIDLSDYLMKNLDTVATELGGADVLGKALAVAADYLGGTYSGGLTADYNQLVTTTEGSVAEWTVLYRAVKYALDDKGIPLSAGVSFADLQKLISSSYDCDKIESQTFQTELKDVVDARNDAIITLRDKVDLDLSADYNTLKAAYDAFNNKLAKYKYSYGEISTAIYEAQKNIDADKYVITDAYKTAVDAAAKAMISLIPSVDGEENFDYYDELIPYNRLLTTTWAGESAEERALKAAYEALKAITLEEKPEFAAGDVDGSGKVDTADALLILDYTVDAAKVEGKTFHVEAADVNGDKVVDTADALAALDLAVKA